MTTPTFGDRVRIRDAEETRVGGYSGQTGTVFGESIPSTSGVTPVIGDRGEDRALSVTVDETRKSAWFAPHLIEFVDHGGVETMSVDGGPSFTRDPDGTWHEVGGSTGLGNFMKPGGGVPRRVLDPFGRVRRWFEKRRQ
jgi:hypothetical protein